MSRTVRDVAVAVALGGIALLVVVGCGGKTSTSTGQGSTPTSVATPREQAIAAARHFLTRYVTSDGRVVRIDQGGDTVGEGQAYGMLLAAAIGDSQRFDSIWGWTKAHLRRPDGLISFRWRDGRVQDPEAASDADLDASRALLLGACRFGQPGLRLEGLALGKAIMRVEVTSSQGAPVLTAGPWAVTPPATINPSYFSPATFAALRAASGDARWAGLTATSFTITRALMHGASRLPPDWVRLEGDRPVPIGSPGDPQAPARFGFDAARVLIRMAEDPTGRRIIAPAWPVFAGRDPTKLPIAHDLSGRPLGDILNPVVLVAAAGAADAAGHPAARDGLLDSAAALDRRFPTYYGAAWVALGRMMLTTNLLNASCS